VKFRRKRKQRESEIRYKRSENQVQKATNNGEMIEKFETD
jgi:hypothetical protein